MFERSKTDKRRIVIVDVSHLFYAYAFGGATGLSSTLMVNGVPTVVDTTLPSYTIKQLHRWANGGVNPLIVCFDGKGCAKSRKAYFASKLGLKDGKAVGYKGSRESQDSRFYEGVNLTMNLLLNGGVCCLKADGYEADDLIKATVDKAKAEYPDLPIDIITGDMDLVPLVDDQVSVFLRSRKSTWAESPEIERKHYVQLTPDNYSEYLEDLTNFKKLSIPYNTVLLTKLLRGDKSDEIPGYPKFTPTKYNKLICSLMDDGYDLSELCRYGNPIRKVCYKGTLEEIPENEIDNVPSEMKVVKYDDPENLVNLCSILSNYLDDDVIQHIRFIYNGINLNGSFMDLPPEFSRPPAKLSVQIKGYSEAELQKSVSIVQIRLPMM